MKTHIHNTLEVCCGNIESVRQAIAGGAHRIELCSQLELDGLTPSQSDIREAVSICHPAGVVVHVLIRSRAGNFIYTQQEVHLMSDQIKVALDAGADGIVIGALTESGDVDVPACQEWIDVAHQQSDTSTPNITFHRAFDVCTNPKQALEQIISLGCNRLLTSGQAPTAHEGVAMLKALTTQSAGRITLLCGSGVNVDNASEILSLSGAHEIHGSLRTGSITDANKVAAVIQNINVNHTYKNT